MPPYSPTPFAAGRPINSEEEWSQGHGHVSRRGPRPSPGVGLGQSLTGEGSSRGGGAISSNLSHGKGKVLLTRGPGNPEFALGSDVGGVQAMLSEAESGGDGDDSEGVEVSEGVGSEAEGSGGEGPDDFGMSDGADAGRQGKTAWLEAEPSDAPPFRYAEEGPIKLGEGWSRPGEAEVGEKFLPGPLGRRHRVLMEGATGVEGVIVAARSRRFRGREISAVRKHVLTRSRGSSQLALTYHIPAEYEVRAAKGMSILDLGVGRADGWCAFYVHHLKFGVAFPLCPELVVTFNHYGIAPSQFTPNAMRIIMAVVSICWIGRIRFTPTIINMYYKLKADAANKVEGE